MTAAVLVAVALQHGAHAASTAAERMPYVTRVRITVTTSSDWTAVEFMSATRRAIKIVSVSQGFRVDYGPAGGFRVTGSGTNTGTATVDAVYQVGLASEPSLRIRKGSIGLVKATVVRRNSDAESLTILNATNSGCCSEFNEREYPIPRLRFVSSGWKFTRRDPRRLTLAFYYPWFTSGSFSQGTWGDKPSGPYDTGSAGHVRDMTTQAASAGIDGWVASWTGQLHLSRFDLALKEAERRTGFWVAGHLESLMSMHESKTSRPDPAVLERWIRDLAPRFASPAYLKVGTKPVLFVWGTWEIDPATWRKIDASLVASGIDLFAIGHTTDPAYGFDGSYFYSPNAVETRDLPAEYDTWLTWGRLKAAVEPARTQMLLAAPTSPGYNDALIRPKNPLVQPRLAGVRYDATWKAAIGTAPEWTLITSWNEWYENSNISPGTTTGTLALEQTTDWTARFAKN